PVQTSTDAEPDLIDSLLEVIGKYEKQSAKRYAQIEKIASRPEPSLFAQVVFPSTRKGGEITETIPLIADKWQKISLSVPESTLLCDKPVILKPLNTNGTVIISVLKLVNLASGEVLWMAQTPQDFEAFKLSGTVLRMSDLDNFILLITGDEPCLALLSITNLPNCSVGFEGWMRVSRNQSIIMDYWKKEIRELDNVKHQLKKQNEKILMLTQSMYEAKKQIKGFSAILSKCNSANVFQSFNRRLENEHIRIIKNKWLPLLELELKDSHLRYLAHKICQIENRCSGRLATTVQDALLRVIVAMSVRKRAISIMEIGSLFGVALVSYYECLRGLFDKINLTAIDPLEGYYDIDQFDIVTRTPVNKSIFESNLLLNNVPVDDVLLIQELSTSKEAFQLAKGQRYDLMIIDGDHTFEGVKYDFDKYNQLITPGGFLFFDDYNAKEWPGVKNFVDQEVRLHSSFKLIESEWRSIVFQKMC
ncbi:MAG: class I SAM-dependent methyltransferase, partial [Desulfosarcina sp.]|nr:class I SAM-dependent methyltransferase [Desulfobacterales bacterium]